MDKTKVMSARVTEDLSASTNSISSRFRISVAELLSRSLNFLRHNPELVIEFEPPTPTQQEYLQLRNSPERSLAKLKEQGISTRAQLLFIMYLVQKAYYLAEDEKATAPWVRKLVHLLDLLLELDIKNRDELTTLLVSNFPVRDGNLYEKIKTILSSLEKQSFVSSYTADYIAQCLLTLVEKADFDLSSATIGEINDLLNPWVFWIARRGIPSEGRIRDIDTTVLDMGTAVPGEKTFKEPGGKVTAHVFLSDEGTGPFRVGKRSFNCGLIFGQEQRKETIINCDARSLYELIKAVNILESGKIMAEYSAWSILRDRKQGYYTLHRAFLSYSLTEEEMEEFVSLVKKLADREDVQRELVKEFVEVYGAI